ncbi:hypothetical protein DMN91_010459 [Ooceraea biroi]|uniref:Reverse transcriptase domain-containing protein n=1 Tax=Ooceraea biroi TaxID=2015173 RepID=A0A3L8D7Z7_OOCBI|nr:hypothetical protein DMN91_010459 [Ooceraea biroi]
MDAPLEVVLAYPIESRVVCPRCWGSGELGVRTRGDFCDPPHLAKHQKAKHPGDTITYKCSLCEFRGSGRYPLKAVKAHYDREHGGHRDESPATVAGADAGRAQNSGRSRVGSASNAGVRTRAAALPGTSSVGAADSRRLRRNLPAATPSPQQTPLAATTTASTTSGRSPSYAAVTAGPSTRPVRAPSLTAGAGGAAVAATRTTTARRSSTAVRRGAIGTAATAATGATPPIAGIAGGSSDASSAERRRPWRPPVPVPVCSACGVPTRPSGTPPQPNPLRVTRSARVPPHKPSNTSSGGTGGAPSVKRRQKGAARPVHVSPRSPQTIAESQQTIGAPRGGNRSGGSPPAAATTSAAALVGAPSAPVAKSTPERTVASRGTAKRSTRSPPATTIAAAAAGVATRRHARRKASQFGVEPGGVWRRGFRTPTPPSSPEGFSEVQVAGVLGRRSATPTARAPTPAVPAQLSTTTTRSTRAGTRAATSSAAVATSSPATLVTCTVTTSVCGAPVMSTGVPSAALRPVPRLEGLQPEEHRPTTPPVGRQHQSPPTSAASECSGGSPALASSGRRVDALSITPEREEERRSSVARRSIEGDGVEPWVVSLGRGARRRLGTGSLASTPSSTPTRGSPAGLRTSPSPPPNTPASFPPLPSAAVGVSSPVAPPTLEVATTSIVNGEARRGSASSGDRAAVAEPAQVSAANSDIAPPAAPVDVRGVMGRRLGGTASVVGARNDGERCLAGRGREPRRGHPRRVEARPGGPLRAAVPAPEPAQGRRRERNLAARDELARLAEAVVAPADLEDLAVRAAEFFGRGVASVAAAGATGATDRPGRSGEAAADFRGGTAAARARDDVGARRGPAPAGPRNPQGEGRGDRTREAARIQALFRRNRRKAVREVVQGPADFCQVQGRAVQGHFERLYGGGERLDGLPAVEPVDHSRPEDVALLMAPFTEGEVDRRLRRMTNSAPGPDGIAYNDLRAADPGARLLTALFNACYRLEAVPPSWKTSNTVLVYKKGDRDSLESWRPLALGDTMPKLFAAVAADRLTDWVIANDKLCRAQKGFLRDEGCYEHNFVLQEILTDARRTRRHAVVAWLDLSNAFGSVPHAAIRSALVRAGVPSGLINIWGSMYDGCTTRVRAVDGFTAPIPIRSGVRQGCPLSPIIFDLVIDSVVRAAAELTDVGYDILGQTFNILAYADDLALIARTPEGMRQLLTAVELEAGRVGLHFNPAKCASLHITTGRIGRVLPTVFEIEGRPMPTLAEGEPYRHLGVPTGFSVDQTPLTTIEGVLKDIWAVDASLLAPWQRVEVLAAFILPRLDFLLRGAAVEKRPLRAVDLHVRRIVKSWLNLPQRASAEVVYLPPSRGGCGLLPLSDLADVLTIAHAFRLLTASDAVVSGLAWGSLRGVVARRIGHAPSDEEIASFLSGSLEGRLRGGGEASLWSRARNAARRQANRAAVRWRWSEVTGEMIVECRGPGERIVRVPGSARAQVIHRLRSAVMEYYAGTLLRKPDQGKVFEVSSRVPVSNHFMRGGSFTRFADWRFVHRARLDVLPLNGARRWGTVDERCRRCGRTAETLPHVIGHCGVHAAAIQLRHDAVLHRLRRACRLPGEVRVNQRVEGVDGELEGLRPDLVVRHEPSKSVVICDVTVAFENRLVAFEEARGRKVARYTPLAEALRAQGYRVVVTALVVGALGSWCPRNDAVLRLLRVGSKYGSMMRRLIVSDTIRWSRDIYVEHVSGVRQYPAPPRPSGDGVPWSRRLLQFAGVIPTACWHRANWM